jgi:hypothetical protein
MINHMGSRLRTRVPTLHWHVVPVCIALVFQGCSQPRGTPRDSTHSGNSQVASRGALTWSYGLRLVAGDGFTIAVPQEAIVEKKVNANGEAEWRIHAPAQLITAGLGTADTTRFTNDRPLYDFTITAHHKPAAQSLKAWGDSVVAADEAVADELDKGETGRIVLVAGDSAYLRHPTCGDCGVYSFNFGRRDRLVEVLYTVDTAEPLGVRKHGIYALLVSTFRWLRAPTP